MVDPKVVDALIRGRNARSPLSVLTAREQEVLARDGDRQGQRGDRRHAVLSLRAVEKHINGIFAKLGLAEELEVHRRVKAVLLYLADS